MKILLTGATGMMGRAVTERFAREADFGCVGLCRSRVREGMLRVDLSDAAELERVLAETAPDAVVHMAAIRDPDEFAGDVEKARRLNVGATEALAKWAGAAEGRYLVYISSDYVFDGTAAPYAADAEPKAANAYGRSKLDGEIAVRAHAGANAAVLRVPVLYGEVEHLGESSVTRVIKAVMEKARAGWEGELVLDDWAVRYPTHVADIAEVLAQMVRRRLAGTFHWSAGEAMTKLDMGKVAAKILGLDEKALKGSGAPANGTEPRPKDCHLDRSALEALGVTAVDTKFAEAAARTIARFR